MIINKELKICNCTVCRFNTKANEAQAMGMITIVRY